MTIKQVNKALRPQGFRITRGIKRGNQFWREEWERVEGGWSVIGGTGSRDLRVLNRHYRNAAKRGYLQ